MCYLKEFSTVNLLLDSNLVTSRTDAFCLSYIKAEKQLRKIFTYLIYQFPIFNRGDTKNLRETLASYNHIYTKGFVDGINNLYITTVKQVYGREFDNDFDQIKNLRQYRNKIFHGAITGQGMQISDLEFCINILKKWCKTIELGFKKEIGFGGFERNSFRKSSNVDLSNYRTQITSLEDYRDYISNHMDRK